MGSVHRSHKPPGAKPVNSLDIFGTGFPEINVVVVFIRLGLGFRLKLTESFSTISINSNPAWFSTESRLCEPILYFY